MSNASLLARSSDWLDAGLSLDPVQQARLRGIQIAAMSIMLFGVPWVIVTFFTQGKVQAAVLSIAILCGPAVIWAARRQRLVLAGQTMMCLLMACIWVGIWERGGLEFSASTWLIMVPVAAFLFLGLTRGVIWSLATSSVAALTWVSQEQGWVSFPQVQHTLDGLVLLDHVSFPLLICIAMWSHVQAQSQVMEKLRSEIGEREKAEKAARGAVRVRDRFLATMSHEVRTPLNGVLGLSQVLAHTPLNEDQRALTEQLQRSGQLLRRLLDDVLDLSKIDEGKVQLEQVPVELRELCEQVAQGSGTALRQRGVEMRVDVAPECPIWVRGDPTRLTQILGNLISNAAKFTEEGGVTLRVQPSSNGLVFAVQDTGIGMSPEQLSKVFAPFTQADSTTTRRFGGTGLGLSISKGLVDAMGGSVHVQSELGSGSTFEVTLPLPRCGPPARPKAPERAYNLRGLRVLVAEDNPVNQVVISRMLSNVGAEVSVVGDGAACVGAWREQGPDLILMDCHMPRMDGYQATREIRAQGGRLPIVALTANSGPSDRQRSINAGMDDHLGKPILMDDLIRTLVRFAEEMGQASA